jgi:hypothetical protein
MGEAVLSPAIPSVAARAGGIFFPLAKVRTADKPQSFTGLITQLLLLLMFTIECKPSLSESGLSFSLAKVRASDVTAAMFSM